MTQLSAARVSFFLLAPARPGSVQHDDVPRRQDAARRPAAEDGGGGLRRGSAAGRIARRLWLAATESKTRERERRERWVGMVIVWGEGARAASPFIGERRGGELAV